MVDSQYFSTPAGVESLALWGLQVFLGLLLKRGLDTPGGLDILVGAPTPNALSGASCKGAPLSVYIGSGRAGDRPS